MLALLRELTAMFRAGIGDSTRISSVSGVIPSIVPNETYGEVISVLAACKTLASSFFADDCIGLPKRISDGTCVRGRYIEAAGALLTPKDGLLAPRHRREAALPPATQPRPHAIAAAAPPPAAQPCAL